MGFECRAVKLQVCPFLIYFDALWEGLPIGGGFFFLPNLEFWGEKGQEKYFKYMGSRRGKIYPLNVSNERSETIES